MVARARFRLLCDTAAHAADYAAQLQRWVATHVAPVAVEQPTAVDYHGVPSVVGVIDYTTDQDARALRAQIESLWGGGSARTRILPGSTMRWHVCRHDEGAGDCAGASGERTVK